MDQVKTMEYRYKVLDPLQLTKDPEYVTLGPIALISTLQQAYGRLISTHDWPALATKLPESNYSSDSKAAGRPRPSIKCFRCQGDHHIRDCPKNKQTKMDKPAASTSGDSKKSDAPSRALAAWKYVEPKLLTVPVVDAEGKEWKFCTKCKCRHTDKVGLYQLSHYDSEHIDNYKPPETEGNLAVVADPHPIPLGPPAATTVPPTLDSSSSSEIEFIGIWHTPVFHANTYASVVTSGTSKPQRSRVEREMRVPPKLELVTGNAPAPTVSSDLDLHQPTRVPPKLELITGNVPVPKVSSELVPPSQTAVIRMELRCKPDPLGEHAGHSC